MSNQVMLPHCETTTGRETAQLAAKVTGEVILLHH